MKKMNKVIAAMMIMAITTTAPAMAANNVDRTPHRDKKEVRMTDRKHNRTMDRCHTAYETTTIKVNGKAAKRKNVVAKAKALYGVKDVAWNARANMLIVTYDAHKTNARKIWAAVN